MKHLVLSIGMVFLLSSSASAQLVAGADSASTGGGSVLVPDSNPVGQRDVPDDGGPSVLVGGADVISSGNKPGGGDGPRGSVLVPDDSGFGTFDIPPDDGGDDGGAILVGEPTLVEPVPLPPKLDYDIIYEKLSAMGYTDSKIKWLYNKFMYDPLGLRKWLQENYDGPPNNGPNHYGPDNHPYNDPHGPNNSPNYNPNNGPSVKDRILKVKQIQAAAGVATKTNPPPPPSITPGGSDNVVRRSPTSPSGPTISTSSSGASTSTTATRTSNSPPSVAPTTSSTPQPSAPTLKGSQQSSSSSFGSGRSTPLVASSTKKAGR